MRRKWRWRMGTPLVLSLLDSVFKFLEFYRFHQFFREFKNYQILKSNKYLKKTVTSMLLWAWLSTLTLDYEEGQIQ